MATDGSKAQLALLLYRELQKIVERSDQSQTDRAEAVYQLLQAIFQEATRYEKLPFATFFARIAYTGHKYGCTNPCNTTFTSFEDGCVRMIPTAQRQLPTNWA